MKYLSLIFAIVLFQSCAQLGKPSHKNLEDAFVNLLNEDKLDVAQTYVGENKHHLSEAKIEMFQQKIEVHKQCLPQFNDCAKKSEEANLMAIRQCKKLIDKNCTVTAITP